MKQLCLACQPSNEPSAVAPPGGSSRAESFFRERSIYELTGDVLEIGSGSGAMASSRKAQTRTVTAMLAMPHTFTFGSRCDGAT